MRFWQSQNWTRIFRAIFLVAPVFFYFYFCKAIGSTLYAGIVTVLKHTLPRRMKYMRLKLLVYLFLSIACALQQQFSFPFMSLHDRFRSRLSLSGIQQFLIAFIVMNAYCFAFVRNLLFWNASICDVFLANDFEMKTNRNKVKSKETHTRACAQ